MGISNDIEFNVEAILKRTGWSSEKLNKELVEIIKEMLDGTSGVMFNIWFSKAYIKDPDDMVLMGGGDVGPESLACLLYYASGAVTPVLRVLPPEEKSNMCESVRWSLDVGEAYDGRYKGTEGSRDRYKDMVGARKEENNITKKENDKLLAKLKRLINKAFPGNSNV